MKLELPLVKHLGTLWTLDEVAPVVRLQVFVQVALLAEGGRAAFKRAFELFFLAMLAQVIENIMPFFICFAALVADHDL